MITAKTVQRLAIREAEVIFSQEISEELRELGKVLQADVRSKMRHDLGAERKNVKRRVTGSGFRKTLTVSGDLVQTLVDEFGRRKGVKIVKFAKYKPLFGRGGRDAPKQFRKVTFYTGMPPSGPGSTLAGWAARKGIKNAYGLALKIARDGIAPGRPFARTQEESLSMVIERLNKAGDRGVKRLNAS